MEFAQDGQLAIWNSYLHRVLHLGEATCTTYNMDLISKLLAILSRIPIYPCNRASVDSITSLLKEYLESFPVISVFLESIDGPFREIPLSILEKQRVKHSWKHRSHRRLPRRISIRRNRRKDIVSASSSGSSCDDGTFGPENSIYGVSIIPHQDDQLDISGDGSISVSEERDIEKMYSKMFNYHSGRISLIENFVNALACFTRFVVYGNPLHGAMFICGLLNKAMDELYYECGEGSPVIQCINWQTIMIQCSRCASHLLMACSHSTGSNHQELHSSLDCLLNIVKRNVVAATQMFQGLQCCDDVASTDKCVRSACAAILSVTEDVLKVFEVYDCSDVLSHLGELIVLWSHDSSFPIVFSELMEIIETRVFQSSITSSRVLRFAFELFASLVNTTCATTYVMDWSLSWPCGFGGTATAFELTEVLTTHIASRNWHCVSVLERHLPFMNWRHRLNVCREKDRSANETDPSNVITELVVAIRSAKSVDYLVHVSACILNSNLLVEDAHHIMLELVIPEIVSQSENLRAAECLGYRSFGSFRSLLNLLEVVLPAIDSYTAEVMIRAVISPYRQMYMKNRDLEDSFIMLTSKCISLGHVVAKESGLSDWLLTCVDKCYKRASQDIWRFMKDSVVKYNRILFCALFIIHNALEYDLGAFDGFERRIRKQSWKIIELARTSLHLSSNNLKVDRRISELVAISISLVLRIDRNARSQLNKFSNAFSKCFENCLQSPVICRIIISVLIKILRFSPEKVKDISFVINHDGIPCILEIVYALLRQSCSLNTEHCFMVRKLCKLLGTVPITQYSDQWLSLLFNVCEILIKKNVELETIDAVLRLLVHNIKHRPRPSYVSAIIGFLCMNSVSEVRHCIFRWFTEMLNDELRAPVSVVMPQRLAESPNANDQTIFVQDSFVQADGRKATESTSPYCSSSSIVGETSSKQYFSRNNEEHRQEQSIVQKKNSNSQIINEHLDVARLECSQGAFSICNPQCMFPREGITLSLWIKRFLCRKQDDHRYVLVGSVVGDALCCSLLLSRSGYVVFEVNINGSRTVKRKFKGRVRELEWTHMCFSLIVLQNTIIAEALVDDCFSKLEIPAMVSEQLFQRAVEFYFGCLSTKPSHWFMLSSVFIFKGYLSRSCVLVLHDLGCRLSSLVKCFSQEKLPNLISILNGRWVLGNGPAVRNACSNTASILEELQHAVIITLDLSHPDVFLAHCMTAPSNEALEITGSSEGFIRDSTVEYGVHWWGEKILFRSPSVDDAVKSIGSIKILLFLYAKFVNDSMPAALQIAALDVLFSSLRRNHAFAEEANRMHLNNILVKALSSRLAYFGDEILQLIIDHCFAWENTEDDTSASSILDRAIIFCSSEAVVRNPDTLITICCRYEIWCGERFCQWRALITIIAKSIHKDMCRQAAFNQFQLSRCKMLQKFFHCLLEMLRNSVSFTDPSDYQEMIADVVMIVCALISPPWDAKTVSLLWNFITISHPASATYLKHDVQGSSDWTNVCFPPDNVYAVLNNDTRLCVQLSRYLDLLGSEYVSSMWCSGSTIFDIRREFEQRIKNLSDQNSLPASTENFMDETSSRSNLALMQDQCENLYMDVVEGTSASSSFSWIVSLRRNVMMILSDVLQNECDSVVVSVLRDEIWWEEILILLTCQEDLTLREAVVKMLQNFIKRTSCDAQSDFLRMDGFRILANQLAGFPVTHAMVDSLFSLMCAEPIFLADGLDVALLTNMLVTRMSCESFHAILVALEESVTDQVLFWNMTSTLSKIFENNIQLQRAMFDCHLVHHLVRVLKKIAYLDNTCQPDFNNPTIDTSILLDAWSRLAQLILTSVVPYNDAMSYEFCEQFIWLLIWADWQSSKDDQFDDCVRFRAHRIIREQLCQLFRCWLECIQHAFMTDVSSASISQSKESLNSAETSESNEMGKFVMDEIKKQGTTSFTTLFTESFPNIRAVIPSSKNFLESPFPKRSVPFPVASIETLSQRLLFVLETILNLFVLLQPTAQVSNMEKDLFFYYLNFMLSSLSDEQQGPKLIGSLFEPVVSSSMWNRLKVISYHRMRLLLAQFVSFTIFPAQAKLALSNGSASNEQLEWQVTMRHALIKGLLHEMKATNHLRSLLNVNMDYETSIYLGLCEMAILSPINERLESDVEYLLRFLADDGVEMVFRTFTHDSIRCLWSDEALSLHSYAEYRKLFFERLNGKVMEIRENGKLHVVDLGKKSMKVTSKVVAVQSSRRKEFMRKTRTAILELFEAELVLKDIVSQLCHPEAPCSNSHCWPVGWALDPTEGPMRERKKLMPSFYAIDASFFQRERQQMVKNNREVHPLINIISNPHSGRHALQCTVIDEHIFTNLDVKLLRGPMECDGELLVGKGAIYFLEKFNELGEADCSTIKKWDYEDVTEVFPRQNMLNSNALEIFLQSGDTYIIVFKSENDRGEFKMLLSQLGHSNVFCNVEELLKTSMRAWRHNVITNFEYIMILNTLSGRSFNDLMQYPVFPFILSDYCSPVLDLQSQDSFRDLGKPMAIQDSKMEAHYINNYKSIEMECNQNNAAAFPIHFAPYHYGSHYSNIGIVTYYLLRLYPYTEMAIKYQDNSFDIADRIFNSIEDAWRLSSSESTTDFKELTPEFFSLSEFLKNHEKFELGTRQGGEVVGDVKLPDWVPDNDARLFILIHRQALESPVVTQNLHLWIDLVFGFKQTGKNAVEAINVFHPSTYSSTVNSIELVDELSQSALSTMVRSYGQMPMQVLRAPHQPHLSMFRKESEIHPAPIETVRGIRWGDYVGNPLQSGDLINVVFSLKIPPGKQPFRVVSLPDGSVVGSPLHCLVVFRSTHRRKIVETLKFTGVTAIGMVSVWRRTLQFRICVPNSTSWFNIADLDEFEISTMGFSPKNNLVILGCDSGAIITYQINFDDKSVRSVGRRFHLVGHSHSISAIGICDEFSVLVSADSSGKVVIWDSNKLMFIRVLRQSCSFAIRSICISRTTADIAIAVDVNGGSTVEFYTINGDLIKKSDIGDRVLCMAMSNQSEGTAINCLALGLLSGEIRLIETWKLSTVRTISHSAYTDPVISVEYSRSARKLFTTKTSLDAKSQSRVRSTQVLAWQYGVNQRKQQNVNFILLES